MSFFCFELRILPAIVNPDIDSGNPECNLNREDAITFVAIANMERRHKQYRRLARGF